MTAQEWVSVKRNEGKSGATTSVTVSLVDGNHSAKWTVRTYAHHIKASVIEARKAAHEALDELKEAVQ